MFSFLADFKWTATVFPGEIFSAENPRVNNKREKKEKGGKDLLNKYIGQERMIYLGTFLWYRYILCSGLDLSEKCPAVRELV